MAQKNDYKWLCNFNALKRYIGEHGHLPNKNIEENRNLLSWAKYNRRKIREGAIESWKKEMFLELMATRSTEHTGGRRKKTPSVAQGDIFPVI